MPTFEEAQMCELECEWVWYAHHPSASNTYSRAYVEIGRFKTVAMFWQYYNAFPSCTKIHDGAITLNGQPVIAYSLFRAGILPEWEDAVNHQGSEWGCRELLDRSTFQEFWDIYIMGAIGEQIPHCVGVRAINKCNRSRSMHKLEVWLDTNDLESVYMTRKVLLNLAPSFSTKFTLMLHDVKQSQAMEYQRRRRQPTSQTKPADRNSRKKTRSADALQRGSRRE